MCHIDVLNVSKVSSLTPGTSRKVIHTEENLRFQLQICLNMYDLVVDNIS